MAIEFKQTHYAGHTPEFWRGEAKILPGGFKPTKDLPIVNTFNIHAFDKSAVREWHDVSLKKITTSATNSFPTFSVKLTDMVAKL